MFALEIIIPSSLSYLCSDYTWIKDRIAEVDIDDHHCLHTQTHAHTRLHTLHLFS